MMDLSKSYEFFQPEMCQERIHIIGCGSVGYTVVELLARFGLTKFSLYDFDKVEKHNLANQMFVTDDIGKLKVDAVANHLIAINPDIKENLKVFNEGWHGQKLSGYVFLCVDNIDLRRKIATENKLNNFIKGMFDFRTRLVDAQHYAADWSNNTHKEYFIGTMNFSHKEAEEATPMSACHVALSVAPIVRIISAAGVMNFINFVKDKKIKQTVIVNIDNLTLDAF